MKCDNCDKPAAYTCADPGVSPVHYCSLCLPMWLRDRAAAGHFPLVEPEVKAKPEPKAKAKVVEAQPSEEVIKSEE